MYLGLGIDLRLRKLFCGRRTYIAATAAAAVRQLYDLDGARGRQEPKNIVICIRQSQRVKSPELTDGEPKPAQGLPIFSPLRLHIHEAD